MNNFLPLTYMASFRAVFLDLKHCSPNLRTWHWYLQGGSSSWLMVTTDGGKVELIAQIYGLCTLINLWYEQK